MVKFKLAKQQIKYFFSLISNEEIEKNKNKKK